MPMKGAEGEKLQLTSYCSKHVPVCPFFTSLCDSNPHLVQEPQAAAHYEVLQAEQATEDHIDVDSDGDLPNGASRTVVANTSGVLDTPKSKSARAYAKSYTLGAPMVPAKIVNNVLQYIHRMSLLKKPAFVQMVCRYWSLKREARRGAPLLKRLYLEVRITLALLDTSNDVRDSLGLELR